MSAAPLLSIGMIFKNEARCLERCLRSLQPLRDAIPCELVMADTGATDGSREIAEKYADCVFDFAWVNDFAAARNAVMDRCSGKWYFSVDCDEWLDTDISELVAFLQGRKRADFAFVMIRNYSTQEMEKGDDYNDFYGLRLVRMSTGERYHGPIHESWIYYDPTEMLTHTILHHDGYLFNDTETAKKKWKRNLSLLRKELQKEPDNLRYLLQYIESGGLDADTTLYIRRAVDVIQSKKNQWELYGGCILRHAAETARMRELPETKEWIEYAETYFPDSIFTRVDLNYTAFMVAHDEENWEEAIRYGEAYRKGLRSLQATHRSKKAIGELLLSCMVKNIPFAERTVLIGLANAYYHTAQDEKALDIISGLDGSTLNPGQVRNIVVILGQIHAYSKQSIAPALTALYEQIDQKEPGESERAARLAAFDTIAAASFTASYREEEKGHDGYHRPAFTAFACLADRCEAGRGAKLMLTDDPDEMRQILVAVEDWQALPIEALEHALAAGVPFPLEERPLNQEIMSGLAALLTHGENTAWHMALALPERPQEYPTPQCLLWTQSVVLAALRSFDWTLGKSKKPASPFYCPEKEKDDKSKAPDRRPECTPAIGLALIRRFAALETAALPALYAPQLLTEQNAALLPPMHRWGFYCAGALRELDAGHPQAYLAALRRGLTACPGEKEMVQFLLDRFMEDARPAADPELLALADKVRAILDAYSPDDPAVAAIRQSPAYQQVAWLIETPSAAPAASALPADVIVAPLPQ